MRAVLQRVSQARVSVKGKVVGGIGEGLLVFLGVGEEDGDADVGYLAEKIPALRVFRDREGKMNLSLKDIGGSLLVISQFTLWGDCRKGRRPSFSRAARPDVAERLYRRFIDALRSQGIPIEEGIFGAMMDVQLVNDGPVTLLLDSTRLF